MSRETGITPRALLDRPKLEGAYRHHLEAFYDLSSGRSRGELSPQPISHAQILAHFEMWRIDSQDERERQFRYFKILDATYLNKITEAQPK